MPTTVLTRNPLPNASLPAALHLWTILAAAVVGLVGVGLSIPARAAVVCSAPNLDVDYQSSSRTIEVRGCNDTVDMTTIKNTGNLSDSILEEVSAGVWMLRASLVGYEGVTIALHGTTVSGDTDWLRLQSDSTRFVTLKTYNGVLDLDSTKVTSWDESANAVDLAYADGSGRAFVLARNRRNDVDDTAMHITGSELGYLGYSAGEAYGVSWRITEGSYPNQTVTGQITDSVFHHNYYGVYTFGALAMVWTGNEFHSNIQYGFDPHDDSNEFLVENNVAHDNGNHGFIVSKRCNNNVFRGNVSYRNLHGFMLDRDSNGNLLEDNEAYENTDGLAIYESSNNTVRGNRFHHNAKGIRVNGRLADHPSVNNLFDDNELDHNTSYGVYFYEQTRNNTLTRNRIHDNPSRGIYIKTEGNLIGEEGSGNDLYGNGTGIYLYETLAKQNTVEGNTIHNNSSDGVSILKGTLNTLRGNTVRENGNYGVKLATVPAATLEENTIEDNPNYGIYIDGGSSVGVLGNTLHSNGTRELYAKNVPGLAVTGNTVLTDGTYGFYLSNADNAVLEGNSVSGPTPGALYLTSGSTNLIIRNTNVTDLAFGDTASSGMLLDTRGYIWQNSRNLAATVNTADARIAISKSNASTLHADRRDLAIDPVSDFLTAQIVSWSTSPAGTKSWKETSAVSPLPADHTIEGLTPLMPYTVRVNTVIWGTFIADAGGTVSFTYTGPYAAGGSTFTLAP